MSKILDKLPKIALYSLLAISVIMGVMFATIGFGNTIELHGDVFDAPQFTDGLLIWAYVLFALALVILVYSLVRFDQSVAIKRNKGVTILDIIVISVALFGICYALGSANELTIVGYEGTDNVGFWARYTDACIYSAYAMVVVTILSVLAAIIGFKRIK